MKNINNSVVIDNTEYEIETVKLYISKFCQMLENDSSRYIVMEDEKNIYTFSCIIAALLCKKTFVLIPNSMHNLSESIIEQFNVEKINSENDLLIQADKYEYSEDILNKYLNYTITDYIAYIVYTSGSTGNPKGVVMSFKAAYNTYTDILSRFSVVKNDVIINISKWSFDLSIFDIFSYIFNGNKLVCINDARNIQLINQVILKHSVTVWNSTPQVLGMYVNYLDFMKKDNIDSLNLILVSGDKFERSVCELVRHKVNDVKIISLGGATECAIWSIYYDCTNGFESNIAPYGYALANQNIDIYWSDEKNSYGEIIISGEGLAEGYFNDIEKTENTFKVLNGVRYYHTGDIGFIDKEGCCHIKGRLNAEVKFCGKRINLDDLSKNFYEEGKELPICIIDDSSTKIGVFIIKNQQHLSKVKKTVKEKFSDIINERDIIEVSSFPLTQNQKIDTESLKEMWKYE